MKRPFAKKTADMQEKNAKAWAENLQTIYDPLINCAKASREIKQLLKKYEAETNEDKKAKYVQSIIAVRNDTIDAFNKVLNEFIPTLGWLEGRTNNYTDTRGRLGQDLY